MGIEEFLQGFVPNVVWDLLKWLYEHVGKLGVFTVLVGLYQKARSGSLDWWLLAIIFFGSLGLIYFVEDKNFSSARRDAQIEETAPSPSRGTGESPAGELLVPPSERQQAPSEPERARQEREKEERQSSLSMMEERRLREDFLSLPRPCQFKVTAPRVHMPFRMGLLNAIRESYIQQFGSFEETRRPDRKKPFTVAPCEIVEDDKDMHPERYPDQITYAPQGIVIVNGAPSHQETVDFLVKAFETRLGWTVRAGRDLPPESPEELIYIQIGAGVLRN